MSLWEMAALRRGRLSLCDIWVKYVDLDSESQIVGVFFTAVDGSHDDVGVDLDQMIVPEVLH